MQTLEIKNKTYLLDDDGFLVNPEEWDEAFAEGMAPALGIADGLTPSHWDVLKFIRETYLETGVCPIAQTTCKSCKLNLKDMERLFPSGYQRGACKLSGISFMSVGVSAPLSPSPIERPPLEERVYRVNAQGFLIDPDEWDEDYASFTACELGIASHLTEKHWQVIRYLRAEFERTGEIPLLYEMCEAADIDLDEYAKLFPSGYHRGVVKIAGLNLAAKRHRRAGDFGI